MLLLKDILLVPNFSIRQVSIMEDKRWVLALAIFAQDCKYCPCFCKKSGLDVILAAFPSFLPQINKNKPWQGAKVEGCEINIGIVTLRKINVENVGL